MKAVEVMGTLLGNNGVEGEVEEDSQSPLEDVEEQELEDELEDQLDASLFKEADQMGIF